jgi:ornithine carbamoyltransferase
LTQRKHHDRAVTKLAFQSRHSFAEHETFMNLDSHPALQPSGATASGGKPGVLQVRVPEPAAPAQAVLKSKNVGLLCDDPALPEALLAYRAAVDLGAHVSLVRPRFTGEQEGRAIPETARMLGRLYDVLACVALPRGLVDVLRGEAGVPVVGDLDIDAQAEAVAGTSLATEERLLQWQRALAASLG